MYSPVPDLATVLERLAVVAAADRNREASFADARRVLEITGPDGQFATNCDAGGARGQSGATRGIAADA
jgi:hypothetical protein